MGGRREGGSEAAAAPNVVLCWLGAPAGCEETAPASGYKLDAIDQAGTALLSHSPAAWSQGPGQAGRALGHTVRGARGTRGAHASRNGVRRWAHATYLPGPRQGSARQDPLAYTQHGAPGARRA